MSILTSVNCPAMQVCHVLLVPSIVSQVFEACRGCNALCKLFILISFAPFVQVSWNLEN